MQCIYFKKSFNRPLNINRSNKQYILNKLPLSLIYSRHSVKLVVKVKRELLDSINTLATSSYLVSKSIILFTLFYCSTNWIYYKNIYENIEEKIKEYHKATTDKKKSKEDKSLKK